MLPALSDRHTGEVMAALNRRVFLAMIAALVGRRDIASAQVPIPGRLARLGYLGSGPSNQGDDLPDALRAGLRESGYVDGGNLSIDFRWAEQRDERLPDLAAQLVHLGVDVIFAPGDPAALAAKQATANVPIVFTGAIDPVANGFVASLSRPGGNMTG
jgi:putative ABC transport system substrate-binding protein